MPTRAGMRGCRTLGLLWQLGWLRALGMAACPVRAARELLWLAAALSAMIPVALGLANGEWFWHNMRPGHVASALVDVAALMAVGFASLARTTARRSCQGESNSVWAPNPTTR